MFHTEHGLVRFDLALPEPRNILSAVNSLGFQVLFGFCSLGLYVICSTRSMVLSAVNVLSLDPGTSSLPSTVSDSRFGLISSLKFICSTLSTVLSASQSVPRTPGHHRCRQQSWIQGLVWFL